MKTNSEKHHDLWLDNVELVDAYDDVLNSIVETLTAKDGEKYAGEGLKFPNAEPPSCVISSRKRRLLPIYCLPDDKVKVRKVWLNQILFGYFKACLKSIRQFYDQWWVWNSAKDTTVATFDFCCRFEEKNIVDEVLTHSFNVQPCGSAKLPLS